MADYKPLYTKLFNAITDVISILQTAQIETEELFTSQEDAKITLLKPLANDTDGSYMCCLHNTPRTFEWCEKNCNRYSSCDTVAQAGDGLNED